MCHTVFRLDNSDLRGRVCQSSRYCSPGSSSLPGRSDMHLGLPGSGQKRRAFCETDNEHTNLYHFKHITPEHVFAILQQFSKNVLCHFMA